MDYKILIIKNRISYDISDDVQKFLGWFKRNTPYNPLCTIIDSSLPLKWKDFGWTPVTKQHTMWGLDGIKDQILNSDYPINGYHLIFFIYEATEFHTPGKITAYAYPNTLNHASFSEVPIQQGLLAIDDLYRYLSHEVIHLFHRRLWDKGIITTDDLDLYDKDFEIEATDGNRARNLKRIAPYWNIIIQNNLQDYINYLKGVVASLFAQLKIKRLDEWAKAIQKYEGYFPGSVSYKNNNPGNLKFTSYTKSLGAVGQDIRGFAKFTTYQEGFNGLKKFLEHAATGKLPAYKGVNLIGFFQKYAPASDNNEPLAYANFVAKQLKVVPQKLISELI